MKSTRLSASLSNRLVGAGFLFAALSAMGCSAGAMQAPRLDARPGCSLWVGSVQGNDRAAMELELCPIAPDSARVVGRVQLTSPRSGWSIREVEGGFTPEGMLKMRDVDFAVSEPEFGWMFCLIDSYELERSTPERASGQYDSRACSDHAAVELKRAR